MNYRNVLTLSSSLNGSGSRRSLGVLSRLGLLRLVLLLLLSVLLLSKEATEDAGTLARLRAALRSVLLLVLLSRSGLLLLGLLLGLFLLGLLVLGRLLGGSISWLG